MVTSNPCASARILVVDDHPLMREGLSKAISMQDDLEVCGQASGVSEALALSESQNPDLMLVDISLKDGHGIELVKQIQTRKPTIKVLIISAYEESLFAERALRAGAMGYINKRECREGLITAIRDVLHGKRYLSADMTQRVLANAVGRRGQKQIGIEGLTDRELEVFELVGNGCTTSEIAKRLSLSPHTVDSHRERMRAKLGVTSSAELMQRAVQWLLEYS